MSLLIFFLCFLYYPTPSHPFQSVSLSTKPYSYSLITRYANSNDGENPSVPKTASQSARSAELKRRQFRIQEGFATPGLSSALPGASDYPIEPSLTEREYFASLGLDSTSFQAGAAAGTAGETYGQVDKVSIDKMDELEKEKQIALHTTLGLAHLRSLRLKAAYNSFEYVYALNPEAYLWQFGLLQYYFGEYDKGIVTCEENARRYESKFGAMGEVASEERIWKDACLLKKRGKKRREWEENGWGDEEERTEKRNIECERRKAIRLARELFSSSVHNNQSQVAMTRVKLQSMCQDDESSSLNDPKMYKLHSYFYVGLHYDALQQVEESKKFMKLALKSCANGGGGNSQDITYLLPVIHMTVRDWYDDDEFEDNVENAVEDDDVAFVCQSKVDEAVELSPSHERSKTDDEMVIRESIKHMRIVDLRQELKKRKLKVGGSKKELQDRLVNDIALEMERR